MLEYDLYIDESGTFGEGLPQGVPFASQLAGILAPHGEYSETQALRLLTQAFAALEKPVPELVHGNRIRGHDFETLVSGLCQALAGQPAFLPVRLVNRESVNFGTIEANYTRMVAHLCVFLLEYLSREKPGTEIGLHLTAAVYMVNGEAELAANEYLERIREQVAIAAIRRGLGAESGHLHLLSIRKGSGRTWRELQVCDLLSNSSHKNFRKVHGEARAMLHEAFGSRDWTLTIRDLDRRVDDLLAEGSLGLALRQLGEAMIGGDLSSEAREAAQRRLKSALLTLSGSSAPARAPQFQALDSWLEEVGEQRREPELAYNYGKWLLDSVIAPARVALESDGYSLDAITLSIWRHALTASNHRGALVDARGASTKIDDLLPKLAGRWESAPVIAKALIAQAVHRTDCLEYADASLRAGSVASYYGELSSLMNAALPDVFPETVRSSMRGEALGTQLQAEMYAGVREPEHFDRARQLNEEAIQEFESAADRARQHQYRAQLETYAGDHAAARDYLARSLGTDATHTNLANAISNLTGIAQGFALLHWWRLGASILAKGNDDEKERFEQALRASTLHTSPWCLQKDMPYPAHGVRRYQAVMAAARADVETAESVVGQLQQLEASPGAHPLMALLVVATQMAVAGRLWTNHRPAAERLLTRKDRMRPGAKSALGWLENPMAGLPTLNDWRTRSATDECQGSCSRNRHAAC